MQPGVVGKIILLCCIVGATPAVKSEVLFYGGRGIGEYALEDLQHDAVTSGVYDDFFVTDEGWRIEALQAYIGAFENALPSAAEWEIRQGVSEGNEGELVASGNTTEFTWQLTGVKGPALFEHIFRVDISDQNLVLAPGSYHLMLRPQMSISELMALLYKTDGVDGVGAPRANGNSFVNSPKYSYYFRPVESLAGQKPPVDFRYSIEGTRILREEPEEKPAPAAAQKEQSELQQAPDQKKPDAFSSHKVLVALLQIVVFLLF